MLKKTILLFLFSVFSTGPLQASDIGFTNVTEDEFKDIIGEFGSAFVHTSVSPASSLGRLFGFEIGIIAGASKSDTIDSIAKELDPNSTAENVPHAGILGAVTFPFGITGEINFLPEINNEDVDFKTGTIGIKWTFTDLWTQAVDMAVKVHGGSSTIKWNQAVSSVATDVEYSQKISGIQFLLSKKLTIFEPYFIFGSVKTTGELKSSAGSVFDSAYTTASSSEEEVTGTQMMVGANLNLIFLKLGLEVGRVLDAQAASVKFSFYF